MHHPRFEFQPVLTVVSAGRLTEPSPTAVTSHVSTHLKLSDSNASCAYIRTRNCQIEPARRPTLFAIDHEKSPVRERRLHEPLPDAEVLEPVLEPRVGHPDGKALGGVLGVGVEVEPQLAQPLERLGGGGIRILDEMRREAARAADVTQMLEGGKKRRATGKRLQKTPPQESQATRDGNARKHDAT